MANPATEKKPSHILEVAHIKLKIMSHEFFGAAVSRQHFKRRAGKDRWSDCVLLTSLHHPRSRICCSHLHSAALSVFSLSFRNSQTAYSKATFSTKFELSLKRTSVEMDFFIAPSKRRCISQADVRRLQCLCDGVQIAQNPKQTVEFFVILVVEVKFRLVRWIDL